MAAALWLLMPEHQLHFDVVLEQRLQAPVIGGGIDLASSRIPAPPTRCSLSSLCFVGTLFRKLD